MQLVSFILYLYLSVDVYSAFHESTQASVKSAGCKPYIFVWFTPCTFNWSLRRFMECTVFVHSAAQADLKVVPTALVWVSMPNIVCVRYVARNGFVRSSSKNRIICLR